MPVFVRDDKSVLFVHVPKTGGTSIENLFRSSGYRMSYCDRRSGTKGPWFNGYRRASPQHMHREALEAELRLDRFTAIFMVVRDPVARFRSEYVMRNYRDLRTDAASVDRWAAGALEGYLENPYLHDNHLRPQSEFYVPGSEVFRYEDGLDRAIERLDSVYDLGVGSTVPRAQRPEEAAGVSTADVEVSDRLRRGLREFYRSDYEQFGY
ncbi:sulfotransferase family 2 domain-containing protein [Isoptericola sp. AK164]|uniref:sulfotransferase family 2 domain-containing protein n=1 Tax=Isoptericola sp. AK164 TaxID=3024246 RepID=UPI002418574D|nr:sulfotransferase family 2 domain-containing protein [Isoptericola sp. AK164]